MKEISKNLKCVVIRSGIQIWAETSKLEELQRLLENNKKGYVIIENEFVRSEDIVGIFTPQAMEELTKRKNGEWQCKYGNWHQRFKKCKCEIHSMNSEELARYSRGF